MAQNTATLIEQARAALAALVVPALLFVGIGSAEAAPATQELTPPTPVTVSVRAPTHCRVAQGIPNEIVYTMLPGTVANVVQGDTARILADRSSRPSGQGMLAVGLLRSSER